MQTQVLSGGFDNPPIQSAQAFRAAMNVMARPGTIQILRGARPPEPLSPAAGMLILTLCDPDTPLFLAGKWDTADVRAWISFHVGAPVGVPNDAMFAVGDWASLAPLDAYGIGTPEYPDRSATLIVEQSDLKPTEATLRGPGIKSCAFMNVPDVAAFQDNAALFPLGLDFFFTSGDQVAALPRTTKLEPVEEAT